MRSNMSSLKATMVMVERSGGRGDLQVVLLHGKGVGEELVPGGGVEVRADVDVAL